MKLLITLAFIIFCVQTNSFGQVALPNKLLWEQINTSSIVDVNGKKAVVLKKNTAFIFISPECPLCKNYMLTLNELAKKYPQVNVVGVVPGKSYTLPDIRQFADDYKAVFDIYLDKNKTLTKVLKAKVTPEAIVIDERGNMRYKGLIDNWQAKLGVKRKVITDHYLDDVLNQINTPSYKYMETAPVGCLINDL
ncbi:redoxin domain-containing protein [Pedobacter alluvionis]|uniref:Redoxin domain-containing protein n=1 Tax=Pedobacter alluvionis TaxID=475253 RepID=A0A497Y4T5_9SPHI|nr:redoxin domain-containing protein [Pedobacter alluvionis]RLJ76785.1 thiol-disulfide isomerase/thioredoxin [Pedobacter alluvionis]TFB33948.1 redoxin domain-containing protein [Pedobacter alluvionis]